MTRIATVYILFLSFQFAFAQQSSVSIQVDASKPVGDMKPFWSFFGYDEPNYTTRKERTETID